MKQITLIGRMGTTILAMILALGLVWLVPPQSAGTHDGSMTIPPARYGAAYPTYKIVSPQIESQISIQSNGSMLVYVLNMRYGEILNWGTSWALQYYPDLIGSKLLDIATNLTTLNTLLESRPNIISWKSEETNSISEDFYPAEPVNFTVIVANPSIFPIRINFHFQWLNSLAAKPTLIFAVEMLTPIGFVLILPWASAKFRKTPHKSESHST